MNAMVGTVQQKKSFNERLTRIASGGENTTAHVFVGPVEEAVMADSERKKKRKANSQKLSWAARQRAKAEPVTFGLVMSQLLMVPFAILIGAACVVAGRAIEAKFVTPELIVDATKGFPFLTPYGIYVDLAIAAVLASLLGSRLGLRKHKRGRAQFVGIAAMLLFEASAISHYPEVFETVYTADYVAEITSRYPLA